MHHESCTMQHTLNVLQHGHMYSVTVRQAQIITPGSPSPSTPHSLPPVTTIANIKKYKIHGTVANLPGPGLQLNIDQKNHADGGQEPKTFKSTANIHHSLKTLNCTSLFEQQQASTIKRTT